MKIGITNGSSSKEQLQADWSQNDSSALDYIKNKPTVDQTYNSTSTNAQSGKAIAGAGFFKNGYSGSGNNNTYINSSGSDSSGTLYYSTAIGTSSKGKSMSVAVGTNSEAGEVSVAIGHGAKALGSNSIQLGSGTSNSSYTFSVGNGSSNYILLDTNTGLIPDERISTAIARVADITSLQAQADWSQTNSTLPDYIKNKPTTLAGFGITDAQSKIDATHKLNGAYIQDSSITSTQLGNGAVITAKIADNAITSDKIKDGTITNADISADASIASSKIRFNATQDAALASGINSTKVAQITKNATDIDNLETWQTGASIDIANLKTTVGGAASGLVKDVADLKNSSTSQGTRLTSAENKISSLETTVGNSSSGLVKDVADLSSDVNSAASSATWGNITGTLANQTDLKAALDAIEAEAAGDITPVVNRVTAIEDKIPAQASDQNQLADKSFVNSSIQTNTAFFDGSWNTWADVPTTSDGFITAGFEAPSKNNYLVVIEDETQDGGTWRYKYASDSTTYAKSNWRAEYQVNETPLTAEQLAALNSGITSTLVGKITANETAISGKQDALTAGTGIDITNNVISSTGRDLVGLQSSIDNDLVTLEVNQSEVGSTAGSLLIKAGSAGMSSGGITLRAGSNHPGDISLIAAGSLDGGLRLRTSYDQLTLDESTTSGDIGGNVSFGNNILTVSSSNFKYKNKNVATTDLIPTVDQTYKNASANPQSGIAIESARFFRNQITSDMNECFVLEPYNLAITGEATGATILGSWSGPADSTGSIGYNFTSYHNNVTAIGRYTAVYGAGATALGYNAKSLASNAIQLGAGSNNNSGTLQFRDYQLLDNSGIIPDARLSSNIARTSNIPTVDQTYNSTSTNAQSGKAIAGAGFLTNSATYSDASLAILGSTDYGHSVVIGPNATSSDRAVAIGKNADASGGSAIAIGFEAVTSSQHAIQIGQGTNNSSSLQIESYPLLNLNNGLIPDARLSSNIARVADIPEGVIVDQSFDPVSTNAISSKALYDANFVTNDAGYQDAMALGNSSSSQGSVSLGKSAVISNTLGNAGGQGTAIGYQSKADDFSVAIGSNAKTNSGGTSSIAIGSSAVTSASNAIQLGTGTNSTANSLQVKTYKLLDTSTGLIPDDRISSNIARASSVPTVDQTYNSTSTNAQSGKAIDGAKFLRNTASATNSLAIIGSTSSTSGSIAIGKNSSIFATGTNGGFQSIAIGSGAQVGSGMSEATQAIAIGAATVAFGTNSIAIGHRAQATDHSIQLGYGKNTTAKTLQIGFGDVDSEEINYQLLDGNTGLIPDARLSSNIARVADLPSAQVQSDWNVTDTTSKAYIANKPTIPTVDQTYSASSANAQSGAAIAGAKFLQNTATGDQSTAIGDQASAPSVWALAVGYQATATGTSVALGWNARATADSGDTSYVATCTAVGRNAKASKSYAVSLGGESEATGEASVALGGSSRAQAIGAIAIGGICSGNYSIHLGRGSTTANQTFNVGTRIGLDNIVYQMLDLTTGKIPNDRLNLDSTPTSASTNGITSGAVYTALQNVHIDVDSALSTTSENPVQNKVVKSALDTKQNTLTWSYDSATETLTIA